ncbi:uncharacterized protein LOC135161904 [Diachasmimorpha longicaudata]|uniref:uncharacterized protein LOC135161904 n=1 Tax=Diachasmimorpha longicaudata TaxID=58733 RepID=UPI0030B8B1FA
MLEFLPVARSSLTHSHQLTVRQRSKQIDRCHGSNWHSFGFGGPLDGQFTIILRRIIAPPTVTWDWNSEQFAIITRSVVFGQFKIQHVFSVYRSTNWNFLELSTRSTTVFSPESFTSGLLSTFNRSTIIVNYSTRNRSSIYL